MRIVLMGVSGCGKSAVGLALSQALHLPFFDGDTYHSSANQTKMSKGIPLTDRDRQPWLEALSHLLQEHPSMILACSALKASYRSYLNRVSEVTFIYLKGDLSLIRERIEKRPGHFFDSSLLESQFALLEEPQDAFVIDITPPVPEIVQEIRKLLKK